MNDRRSLRRDAALTTRSRARGAVSLEFIVLAPVVFLFVLGIFQVIHGYLTRELVEYATWRGARAAAVWLQEADTEPGTSQADAQKAIEAAVALAMTPLSPPAARTTGRGALAIPYGSVAQAVGAQASAPVGGFDGWNAHRALDHDVEVKKRSVGKAAYAFSAVKVDAQRDYGANRARVDVEYAFYCAWPLANIFYGLKVGELGGFWSGRLASAGVTDPARIRILESKASHFMSNKPGS